MWGSTNGEAVLGVRVGVKVIVDALMTPCSGATCTRQLLQPGRCGTPTPERTGSDRTAKGMLTPNHLISLHISDSLALVDLTVQSHRHPVLWLSTLLGTRLCGRRSYNEFSSTGTITNHLILPPVCDCVRGRIWSYYYALQDN